ncbi:ADP-ribose glycohydrolase MACROD2 isoform X2 [Betta splendens]|uniref:ADP-ribose glycohydrolase MACROD2 isoform X2 n=1 Tax=Betta splendens TaxID=158456 RepID=A0A6P7PGF8_BETSP|nr:ADP-ribose glycohydrolase MACROD2 isoform X2 [Betta splendens]
MSKMKKDWKTEKERLLRLDWEERRKEYRCQDYIPLDKIPTWREENRSNDDGSELTGGGGISDKVSLHKGDITLLEVDAIVNAAKSSLLGGGGVDFCIHKAAGTCLYDECRSLNGCEIGKAKITCGYDLPARYVIHTVGPVAKNHVGQTERDDLASCYKNTLMLMAENNLRTVAFPCISTGIYGFPNLPAADIALNTVKNWIEHNSEKITRVIFCVFLETDFHIYKDKMSEMFKDNVPETAEEPPKGDETPPPAKSTAKEESGDGDRGKEEAGAKGKNDNGSAASEGNDVPMESQNPDDDGGNEEEGQDQDMTESRDLSGKDEDKDEDKGTDNDINKEAVKEEEQAPAQKADDNLAEPTVSMEVAANNTDTSNDEEMKDSVKSAEEPDSIPTVSIQPKETTEDAEKKE